MKRMLFAAAAAAAVAGFAATGALAGGNIGIQGSSVQQGSGAMALGGKTTIAISVNAAVVDQKMVQTNQGGKGFGGGGNVGAQGSDVGQGSGAVAMGGHHSGLTIAGSANLAGVDQTLIQKNDYKGRGGGW